MTGQRVGLGMLLFICLFSPAALTTAADQANADQAGISFFENKIRPVLAANCYKCHSADAKKVKAGLLLDTRDGIRKGGETGPAIVPGDVKKSLLLSAIRHDELEMPPDKKLPDQVIADFVTWVKMGAPDPREGGSGGIVVQKSIDIEKGREFWCFQPVKRVEPPKVNDAAWPQGDVDRFILAKLDEQGLKPVADADPRSLVRRLSFDLTGLPPTAGQLADFESRTTESKNPQSAIDSLVDELLASPQFGEHWGRHWLDVARYAESNGNTRNATFPHAWRYRDYVIDAFNADTPYDRFVTEQIAGDLLPHNSPDERNRDLIATGFLALGSKPVIKKGKGGGFVPDIAADQIEVTSRAVLGLTVACARCHDHKFDPIPTTDFYALAGIFASSETLYGGGGNNMGGAPATDLHVLVSKDANEAKAYVQWKKSLSDLQRQQKAIAQQLKKLRPKGKKKNKKGNNTDDATPTNGEAQDDQLAKLTDEAAKIADDLKRLQRQAVEPPGSAMGIRDAGKVTEVPIYIRGESPKGSPIPRGFVTVAMNGGTPDLPADGSGRLELARWLASSDNPLTARVMVNRIWLHLFGEGIVRTPDNFGVNGDRPSHPELLDWLAARFVDDGWSVKKMIRRLVLTRAYGLSNEFNDHNYEVDPDNVYVWRHPRRRLPAEAIRDAILAASGQLELERPQGSPVSKHGGKLIQDSLTPDTIHEPSNHRSVYLAMMRNGLPEVLEVFDVADPSLVVGRRSVTTVPAQDLYLMNSPFVVEQSKTFARSLLAADADDTARVEAAYLRCLSRPPTSQETDAALAYVKQASESLGDSLADDERAIAAWAGFCQALFVSGEFRHTN